MSRPIECHIRNPNGHYSKRNQIECEAWKIIFRGVSFLIESGVFYSNFTD